jgi:hypothetical protein
MDKERSDMGIAALIAWIITAGGGFVLLSVWLRRGGMRQQAAGTTSFRPGLIFGHFLLAAVGLVLWLAYVVTDTEGLTWPTFGLLVVVALLGATMFLRWLRVRGAAATVRAGAGAGAGAATSPAGGSQSAEEPAERGLPVPVVALHGVLAVATAVLVLLTALGVGGD